MSAAPLSPTVTDVTADAAEAAEAHADTAAEAHADTAAELRDLHLHGLPGPSHHYGGLSHGNRASTDHGGQVSNPKAAALQCLGAMRTLIDHGVPVALAPPLARPDQQLLRDLGFEQTLRGAILFAEAEEPDALRWAWSSAAMWTANAATVAPGLDTDGTTRILTANLISTPHRAREHLARFTMLQHLLNAVPDCQVLSALPGINAIGDEGAANHTRLATHASAPGMHLFVHGRAADTTRDRLPQRFPARQSLAASKAAARRLHLPTPRCVHVRQTPAAIDAGAFHNDVVMVSDGHRLLLHEDAVVDCERVTAQIRCFIPNLQLACISRSELSLDDAVRSYLFNSQFINGHLFAPSPCNSGPTAAVIARLLDQGFITGVTYVEVEQSMANGGGPACLRLRIPLRADQLATVHDGFMITHTRLAELTTWVERHYRDRLATTDLCDPNLIGEHHAALRELSDICHCPTLYAQDTP